MGCCGYFLVLLKFCVGNNWYVSYYSEKTTTCYISCFGTFSQLLHTVSPSTYFVHSFNSFNHMHNIVCHIFKTLKSVKKINQPLSSAAPATAVTSILVLLHNLLNFLNHHQHFTILS